jgi:glutaredoxin-like protein
MSLISDEDRTYLVDYFAREVKSQVKVVYFTQHASKLAVPSQECLYCKETRELLEEVSALSDQIQLETHDFVAEGELAAQYGVDKIPAAVLTGAAKGKVRFFGIPSGYEFASLIEGIADVSKGTTDLSAATKAQLAKLEKDVHIQVFVTPT